MISQHQIARLVEVQEYRQLVDRILANGRCRSATARRVLGRSDMAAAAGIGLALQRLSEITYRADDLSEMLAARLLELQHDDGWFGNGSQTSGESLIAASAVAVRGLMALAGQHRATGWRGEPLFAAINGAIQAGLDALQRRLSDSGPTEHDAIGWAIALWQLGDMEAFRSRVAVDDLLELLDEAGAGVLENELCRYAHAMAA